MPVGELGVIGLLPAASTQPAGVVAALARWQETHPIEQERRITVLPVLADLLKRIFGGALVRRGGLEEEHQAGVGGLRLQRRSDQGKQGNTNDSSSESHEYLPNGAPEDS